MNTTRDAAGSETAHAGRDGLRALASRHRRALAVTGAVVATGMAVLWTIVVPERAEATSGVQSAAIRWAHPATWALLATLAVLTAAGAPRWLRSVVGWASLACYAIFLLALNL